MVVEGESMSELSLFLIDLIEDVQIDELPVDHTSGIIVLSYTRSPLTAAELRLLKHTSTTSNPQHRATQQRDPRKLLN